MKHKNIGDSFDSFLKDEGILEQVEDIAIKRVIAFQLQEEMKLNLHNEYEQNISLKRTKSKRHNRLLFVFDNEDLVVFFTFYTTNMLYNTFVV